MLLDTGAAEALSGPVVAAEDGRFELVAWFADFGDRVQTAVACALSARAVRAVRVEEDGRHDWRRVLHCHVWCRGRGVGLCSLRQVHWSWYCEFVVPSHVLVSAGVQGNAVLGVVGRVVLKCEVGDESG